MLPLKVKPASLTYRDIYVRRAHTIANGIVPPFRTGAPRTVQVPSSNSPGLAVGREFKGRIQRRLQPFQPMDRQGG